MTTWRVLYQKNGSWRTHKFDYKTESSDNRLWEAIDALDASVDNVSLITGCYIAEPPTLNDGDKFFDLETFQALPDGPFVGADGAREHMTPRTGSEWIALYQTAKKSFEKYGTAGPPVGSRVLTLRAGFGCSGSGVARIFDGKYWADERYFVLSDPGKDSSIYLSYRNLWWREFKPE